MAIGVATDEIKRQESTLKEKEAQKAGAHIIIEIFYVEIKL